MKGDSSRRKYKTVNKVVFSPQSEGQEIPVETTFHREENKVEMIIQSHSLKKYSCQCDLETVRCPV